jgi:hypothetical protein
MPSGAGSDGTTIRGRARCTGTDREAYPMVWRTDPRLGALLTCSAPSFFLQTSRGGTWSTVTAGLKGVFGASSRVLAAEKGLALRRI